METIVWAFIWTFIRAFVRVSVWEINRLIDCMGVRTGDRVDVCRAVRRAIRRDELYGD